MIRQFFNGKMIFVYLFWLFIFACFLYVNNYHYQINKWQNLSNAFETKFEQDFWKAEKQSIVVKELTDFEWDQVCAYATRVEPIEYYLSFVSDQKLLDIGLDTKRYILTQPHDCILQDKAVFQKDPAGFHLGIKH